MFEDWSTLVQENYLDDIWKLAEASNVKRISVLGNYNKEAGKTYGPLYFDIDNEDLAVSLEEGKRLVRKLIDIGVNKEDLDVHLSGTKGIHVFIDARVLGIKKPIKDLHKVYAKIASYFNVTGTDDQVYSGKKGRLFWVPGAFRKDKGVYKVRVTTEQLFGMTAEVYKETVKNEPIDSKRIEGPLEECPTLVELVAEVVPEIKNADNLPKPERSDLSPLGTTVPDCVWKLIDNNRGSFNDTQMQLKAWLKDTGATAATKDSVITKASNTLKSDRYDSPASMQVKLGSYPSHPYSFNCAAMKKVTSAPPSCHSCKMFEKAQEEGVGLNSMMLFPNMGQYYKDPEYITPVTSFTLSIESQIFSEVDNRVESSSLELMVAGGFQPIKIKDFNELAWTSKSAFKKEIKGIPGATFLGTDDDVSKLYMTVCKDSLFGGLPVDKVIKATKVGLQYRRRKGPDNVRDPSAKGLMVYVEPEFSITSTGRAHSHLLVGNIEASPSLRFRDLARDITDKGNQSFHHLCNMNRDHVIGRIMGWYLASHLKSHCHQLFGEFPLLSISGIAGTGKNRTVACFQRLSGLEGGRADLTLEAPNSTKLPFQQGLSNSTTIPRIINEVNPKSMSRNHYATIVEILKASYDFQTISKGRIGGGDKNGVDVSTMEWMITAPVATLSEEPIKVPALAHRSISVELDPQGNSEGTENFMALTAMVDDLVEVGSALTDLALHTQMMEIDELFEANPLPDQILKSALPDRLKMGYRLLFMAYEWAIKSMQDKGLSSENVEKLKSLKVAVMDHLITNLARISAETSINEVDKILRDFAIMAHNETDLRSSHVLEFGRHYVVDNGSLYLDTLLAYPLMQRFKNGASEGLGIKTHDAFVMSCRSLSYFQGDNSTSPYLPTRGRGVLRLSIEAMKEVNIPVEMYKDGSD